MNAFAESQATDLNSLRQIHCQDGLRQRHLARDTADESVKQKRKSRSTRRRLNAMMNNASLHFSDTDSEGELTHVPTNGPKRVNGLLRPVEDGASSGNFLTVDAGSRRGSFVDCPTDVDEIYGSDPEDQDSKKVLEDKILVEDQLDTEVENMSDEEEDPTVLCVPLPRSGIICTLHDTVTTRTKEGNGPFSVEVRNQMSMDEPQECASNAPDIVVVPTTDTEEMEASDNDSDEEVQGDVPQVIDVLSDSQIDSRNVNKVDSANFLGVGDNVDDALSDNHTDVEDLE